MAAAFLDIRQRSIFTYHRVLLFNYDVQCKLPFCSYNRNMFNEEEIPKSWFTGPLTPANRRKVLSLSALGGGRFSVFAKIEIGSFIFEQYRTNFFAKYYVYSKALVRNVGKQSREI